MLFSGILPIVMPSFTLARTDCSSLARSSMSRQSHSLRSTRRRGISTRLVSRQSHPTHPVWCRPTTSCPAIWYLPRRLSDRSSHVFTLHTSRQCRRMDRRTWATLQLTPRSNRTITRIYNESNIISGCFRCYCMYCIQLSGPKTSDKAIRKTLKTNCRCQQDPPLSYFLLPFHLRDVAVRRARSRA